MYTCPSPDKASFTSRRAALTRLDAIIQNPRTATVPTDAYACQCGKWHLTSHPTTPYGVDEEQFRRARGEDRRYYRRPRRGRTYDPELTQARRKRNLDLVTEALEQGKTRL